MKGAGIESALHLYCLFSDFVELQVKAGYEMPFHINSYREPEYMKEMYINFGGRSTLGGEVVQTGSL
ncbi:hypothetical protein D9Q81_08030 [Candidatus Korarchaeum cryptofilum]|uniref:Uncharacterized protein n=1 Tax=Candidatus Korarchaeum cryptofilum TaxID=498846 RepID=A0A429G1Q1_9CREN|nr:hypothetical protein D9Q81_08030 [Candidatus Korarchaeum cryptofilum]